MQEERENRNAIFDQRNMTRGDLSLEIPTEIVPLPSCGAVYDVNSQLYGRDVIELKAMTTREEDILTNRALLKKGTVITELIKSCLVDKSIDPSHLLIGDRNALMVAIRITGYGEDYDAEIECSSCQTKSPQQFNLATLPIKRLSIDPVEPGTNKFEFMLPYSKKLVQFKFLTGRDEEEINLVQERQKKLGVNSESPVTTNLLYTILSIDGVHDRAQISNFVRNMPARDSRALREFIRDNEPGIIMRQEVTCKFCDYVEEVNMPLGVNFFWPSAGR